VLVLAASLSFVIGLTLGLLGAGGGVLMVPMLVYLVGLPPKRAIVTSLVVVGATSLLASIPHARAGRVRYAIAIVFGLAGMAGAYGGGRVARFLPAPVLLLGLASVMVLSSLAMLLGRRGSGDGSMSLVKGASVGAVVGSVAGMVGAGGGFLIVPALVVFGGVSVADAIGTSLLVISMQCVAAVSGHLAHTGFDLQLAATVGTAAIAGSLVGAKISQRVSAVRLRSAFAWLVCAMAMLTITQELTRLGVATALAIAAVVPIPLGVGLAQRRMSALSGRPR
jgi:uncharacterized protein